MSEVVVTKKKARRGGKKNRKIGRKSKRPSQQAYVKGDRLSENKVRNLLKHRKADGSPRFQDKRDARKFWLSVRKRRVRTAAERMLER